ncbi:efflux RND transporter periplasmic adaptor subunit [Enterovirga aerilata]|uniref:Efflux RND transporter periplasmic adaptor subunit n=1 Tax=Enterovirga aerilata TaxID=2730920 RepID=A0A849I270_9HYPH|nr:efflux RND transporter periplasmic adaptor subunit [Enterovirga sp. DB1703]NNM73472.1 efflux RND transporter periplasmic adaptor subunit [Enterovirga sp. DB1703]
MKRSVLLIAAMLVIAAAAGFAWLGGAERLGIVKPGPRASAAAPSQAAAGPVPVPVEITSVRVEPVSDEVEALGTLMADESVAIAPEIAGRLMKLGFREGDRVKAGQMLVELDTAILTQELKQAQVDRGLARDTFERANSLVQRGAGTRVALEQAEAQLAAAEVRVALAQARLEKATIAAPIDGIVGLRSVSVGTYLTPGQTVVTLTKLDPIKVDFRVPELLLQDVAVGQKIRVRVDAFPDRVFEGAVYAIDPVVDVNGRAIRLRARIPNPDLLLKPGLFARVSIVTDIRESAVVVPESAVVPDGSAKAVYVVEGDKARLVRVRLGKRLPGRAEIAEGLKPGQRIVTTGQMRLRDGSPIEAVQPQAKAGETVTQ